MSAKKEKDPNPPRLAEWIVERLAWAEDRCSIQENLREEYLCLCEARGTRPAGLWYWGHLIRSLFPFFKFTAYWRSVMFKNYLKIVLRSIDRHRGYSFINIAGLAIGFACFILISLWIHFEISYDRFHENREYLYQAVTEQRLPNGDLNLFPQTPAALASVLKEERPEIKNVSRSVEWIELMLGIRDKRFIEKVRFVDPAFLEMFTMDFVEGNPQTALSQPNSIVLTENMREKLFGGKEAVGQEILVGQGSSSLVTGVVKEIPANSFLDSRCMLPMTALRESGWDINEWGGGNYYTYVQLEEETNPEFFKTQVRDIYKRHAVNWEVSELTVRPVTRIHLYDLGGGGPIVYVYIVSGLSFFILLLAMVNFTNLATARSFLRAKEIGVRKTAGAYRQQVTKQILMESVLVTFFSGCLAVVMAYFLQPVLNRLTGARIGFDFDVRTALFIGGVVILTGIVSGLYPAVILSGMDPVRAIKGGIRSGRNSLVLRKVLITFQFSLSIFMIIAMIGVNKQLKYLQNKDLGYERGNIISVGLDQEISAQYRTLHTELMRNPDVLGMTRSSSNLERAFTTTGGPDVTWEGKPDDREMGKVHLMRVDPEFQETFGINVLEGRFFSNEFPSDRAESVVINETALRAMGLEAPVGKRLSVWNTDFRIIGVVKDFHFYSLHEKIEPLIFVQKYAGYRKIFMRISPQNMAGTLSFIRNTIKEIVPGYVPDIQFLDENLQNVYVTEQRMVTGTRYFTLLAIFISCIGLFGLASFSARQRTKEIAIRKVLGASEGHIVFQLFKETLICVAAANAVIFPVAFLVLRGWLQNYAYHAAVGIGIFVLASTMALALAFLSAGWNVVKASLANPVDSLRCE
jgi:putative ABC transport system permease protein